MIKLDVLGATLEVLQGVWVHFFDLLRIAWLGLLLIAAAVVLPFTIVFFTQDDATLAIAGGGTFLVLYLMGFSLCAVHWHRLVLQGVEHASRPVRVSSVLRY